MTRLTGYYFDGVRPIAVNAEMQVAHGAVALAAGTIQKEFEFPGLRVSPRVGDAQRFTNFPDGGQFICADHPCLDSLPQESPSEGLVAWLEARWPVALVAVALTLAVLGLGYFFGLPAVAERIAARIPLETEHTIGNEALVWLDKRGLFERTELFDATQTKVQDRFDQLVADLPVRHHCRLEFRSGPYFGPNAFAFPGGIIIITDAMVKLAEDWDEVAAVLAHEIGHVEKRHALRSILQNSIIGVAVAAVTADAATLSAVVAGLPMVVAETKYSRDFETEADQYAFRLLKAKGYSPESFATLMERLEVKGGGEWGAPSWISSHPVTAERIDQARKAAEE